MVDEPARMFRDEVISKYDHSTVCPCKSKCSKGLPEIDQVTMLRKGSLTDLHYLQKALCGSSLCRRRVFTHQMIAEIFHPECMSECIEVASLTKFRHLLHSTIIGGRREPSEMSWLQEFPSSSEDLRA